MDTIAVKHNVAFNAYTAYTQVTTYHSDKQEIKMPDQQNKEVSVSKYVTNGS